MLSQLFGVFRGFSLLYIAYPFFNIRRETSNKALNAINEFSLVPFLMSFLAARDQLPLAPVTSAGTCVHEPRKYFPSLLKHVCF
jgi:hypothetical protein